MPEVVTTEERPVLHPAVWSAVAVLLAVLLAWRGYEMGQAVKIKSEVVPLARLIPLVLGVSGFLGGAGLGLLLADIRRTTTTTVVTPDGVQVEAMPPASVITSVVSAAKDLSPGKLLVLLAVALLSATLFAVSPDTAAADTPGGGGSNQGRQNG